MSGRAMATVAIAIACLRPVPASAQGAAGGPALTPEQAQAQEMGLTLASFCNPARHRGMGASESVIERASGSLEGTASFLRSAEGTFLVLEAYDQELAGHCLVLGWFGGDLEAVRYPIRRLAMSTLEAEAVGSDRSFYAMAAVRTPDESSMFVTDTGALELATVDGGSLTGTFELSGFVVEGAERTEGVTMRGSFSALEAP